MRPRTVLLDLDGTLLDDSGLPAAVADTCRVLASRHPRLDAARVEAANALAWSTAWNEGGPAWIVGETDSAWLGREAWRRTFSDLGFADPSLVTEAQRVYEGFEAASQVLFPDVASTLAALDGAGVRLGLITNGASETQRGKIRRLGLDARIPVIVISGEVGVMKPDPAIFSVALSALDAAPDDAWHVGDSLSSDVAGANAAAVRSVWLNRDGRDSGDVQPRYEIQSLDELVSLLADAE